MKKIYKKGQHISDKFDGFANRLEKAVIELQNEGLQIEIQYAPFSVANDCVFTALVLGYEVTE